MAFRDGSLLARAGQQDFALSPFYQSGGSRPFANYTSVTAASAPPPNSVGYVAPPQQVPTQQASAPAIAALTPPQTTGQGLAPAPTPVAPSPDTSPVSSANPFADLINPAPAVAPPPTDGGSSLSPQQQALDNFANSAGMDFILRQGENAIQHNYAARGALDSGAAMKALRDYAQHTAQADYFMPYMGLLGGQQSVGAGAASSIAGVGQNFANAAGSVNNNIGSAYQTGANNAAEAAATRGLAGANLGNGIATGLGQVAGALVPTYGSSYSRPSPLSQPISVNSGTSNYFANNPFGGSVG